MANPDGVNLTTGVLSSSVECRNAVAIAAIKKSLGILRPAPRDFVGLASLAESESRSVMRLHWKKIFFGTSAYSRKKTIYWKYLDYEIKNTYEMAQKFAQAGVMMSKMF